MGIKVVALHHANVRLETSHQAQEFYGRVLGLERDPSIEYTAERPLIWWNVGKGSQLHTPIGPPRDNSPVRNHFALAVESIEEAKRTLRTEGIHFDEQTIAGRGLQLFVKDPAGNLVELFQASS